MALFKLVDTLPKEKTKGYVYLQRASAKNALMYADVSETERVGVAANAIVQKDEIIEADEIATINDIAELREQLNELLIQVSMGAKMFPITLEKDKWSEVESRWIYEEEIANVNDPESVVIQCTENEREYSLIMACKVEEGKIQFIAGHQPINPISVLVIIK